MPDAKSERQEKKLTAKQERLAKAREMHDDYLEDGGSLDFISNMGCRAHAQAMAIALEQPGLYDHCVLVTQNRKQVGLAPLDPFKLMLDGTLIERSKQSEDEVEDKVIENKADAEREEQKKKRRNAANGGLGVRG